MSFEKLIYRLQVEELQTSAAGGFEHGRSASGAFDQVSFSGDGEKGSDFFREMLADVDEPTLPFGLSTANGIDALEEASCTLGAKLVQRLQERAAVLSVTPSSICHLAWALVLARTSGSQDVVFGVSAGRSPVPIPARIIVDQTSAAESVKLADSLLSKLDRHRSTRPDPAYNRRSTAKSFVAVLNYREIALAEVPEAETYEQCATDGRSAYPLTMTIDASQEDFCLTTRSAVPIDPRQVNALMETAIERLIEALEATSCVPICAVDVLPAAERRKVLEEWNTTEADYSRDKCIHELFEAQAAKTPDAVAVIFEDRHLTYAELNTKANQLAHYLVELGVKPDDRVAICVERSLEMVVGLLAILKAGGAYVPLDPAYPAERLAFMLQDSAPVALLTQGTGKSLVLDWVQGIPMIDLETDAHLWASLPQVNSDRLLLGLHPYHLAYVIYTSGSTGQPKGVLIEHRNVTRLFAATDAWFNFNEDDVWSLFHSFAFDFSVWEIWGALLYGGRLVVVPLSAARSPEDFFKLLCDTGVTVLNQTPSAFRGLIKAQAASKEAHRLRYIIFGGELLEVSSLRPWYANNLDHST